MNIKENLIGAALTLAVTVLAGIAVYYWTKEPDSKKTEVLSYSVNQVARFSSGTTHVGFNVARVRNDGGVPAHNVVITVDFPTATITDHSVESASGLTSKSQTIDKGKATFVFDTLVPSDAVTVSLLTSSLETPEVKVRSNDSLGQLEKEKVISPTKEKLNKFLAYFVPIVGVISAASSIFLTRVARRRPVQVEPKRHSSRNDMGFILLHQGLTADAESILNEAVLAGEDASFSLSNLAVCRAINGNTSEARGFISAASFYATDSREKAVVKFNDATVSLVDTDTSDFFVKLKEALTLDPEEIQRYCEYSVLLDNVRSDSRFAASLQAPQP